MGLTDRAAPPDAPVPDITHALTEEAPPSIKTWTRLLSWDSLRYQGSNWWLDRILPKSPAGLIAAAIILPTIWFGVGYAITEDRAAFLDAPDAKWQTWFFALHIVTLRVMASMWARGLDPSLGGLGVDERERRRVARGALGHWANVGAVLVCLFFIVRDTYKAIHEDPSNFNLNWFDDPEMWGYQDLGHQIRNMMVGLWDLEWVIFGYLLWIQVWGIYAITRAIRRTDFKPRLARLLIRDEYRDFFTLLGKTATISMIFTLGNLLFIWLSGELFPREVVVINGVGDVFEQMSDVLSISFLFALIVVGMFVHLIVLRKSLTRAVNDKFGAAGDAALELLSAPVMLTGDPQVDNAQLHAHVDAQSAVIRAVTFQREIDALGGRLMRTVIAKAVPTLFTAMKRIAKMQVGAP